MVTLQSVQAHTGLTHPFNSLTIGQFGTQGLLSAKLLECQKIVEGRLDQYGPEHSGRLIFATIRKSVGLERVKSSICDTP